MSTYDEIVSLPPLESIRRRPGMYVGSVSSDNPDTMPPALIHIIQEVISNSLDEAHAGFGDTITITIHEDESISVSDEGRGIPRGDKFDDVIRSFTVPHSSGKFDSRSYAHSAGLNGIGLKAVTALSTSVDVSVTRIDEHYEISFALDEVTNSSVRRTTKKDKTGTTITFRPDGAVFSTTTIVRDSIVQRAQQCAYLAPHVTITVVDERETPYRSESFHYPDGISEMVRSTAHDTTAISAVLRMTDMVFFSPHPASGRARDEVSPDTDNAIPIAVDAALMWVDSSEIVASAFCNGVHNYNGGKALDGAYAGIFDSLTQFAKVRSLTKKSESLRPADMKEGLIVAVSVTVPEAILEFDDGQTKGSLSTREAFYAAKKVLSEHFSTWMYDNVEQTTTLVGRMTSIARAKEAALKLRNAHKETRGARSKKDRFSLNTKLVDASPLIPPTHKELFIVEGDSAAGSMINGRDVLTLPNGKKAHFQAVLPIRGKILNPYMMPAHKALANAEISTLITALGTGCGSQYNPSALNYDKVIILSDADNDGYHIRALLLSVLYTLTPELIADGHVYIAQPPLFRVRTYTKNKPVTLFAHTEQDKKVLLKKYPRADVTRLKGLGEMDSKDLNVSTTSPATRTLVHVSMSDAARAKSAMDLHMSKKSGAGERRRRWIIEHAALGL